MNNIICTGTYSDMYNNSCIGTSNSDRVAVKVANCWPTVLNVCVLLLLPIRI